MRRLLLSAFLLLGVSWADAGELTLVIKGKELSGQTVLVALFATPDTFPSGEPLHRVKAAAEGNSVELRLPDLSPGSYGVSAYCDRNGNSRLDKNWLGKPLEPYGFSRDARAPFGPPPWSEAMIQVGAGEVRQEITLR